MKIAVALSGGVDSAVSAALLKQQGHQVIGVFMKNWSDDFGIEGNCPWEEDQREAKAVADFLNIDFITYNFELDYREKVIDYFFNSYKSGKTPNPDVLCNSEIKFNVFLKKALRELNVDAIATGHYARINERHFNKQKYYSLLRGIDPNKDQSYFLCRLTQKEIEKVMFPIGHLHKSEVREIAKKTGLPNAQRKDSQGICFVGKVNVRKFIEQELGIKPGKIIDIDSGKILGEHKGIWFYTIGQREGLGLGGGPWFVVDKNASENIIIVAKGANHPALFSKYVVIEDINIINPLWKDMLKTQFDAEVVLRYRQDPAKAQIIYIPQTNSIPSRIEINFYKPQRAVAPGQFGCVYFGEELVCSGIIQ